LFKLGFCCINCATAPAAWGDEDDVPANDALRDVIFRSGPDISGLFLPSTVGPSDEKYSAVSDKSVAPTVNTEAQSDGCVRLELRVCVPSEPLNVKRLSGKLAVALSFFVTRM